nr:class I SAM-dependent methyltransferase [Dendrosporobacter quercicolus]
MNGESSHSLILRQIKPKSVVLEIGTATGYMTKYLKETLQCSVTGIEVDQLSAAKAAVYADKMIVTDLNNFEWVGKLSNNKFDYIILADVLEHLQNPYEVLQRTVGFLKENGKIVASIPNIAHNAILMDLMQDKFKYHSFGLLDDSHIFFFTENTIRHLFHSSGLEICQWEKIIVSPKNTEFKQNYDRFPYAVKEYLQQRATGEIYQFIVCGRKVADLLKNKRVVFFGSGLSNQLLLQCFPVKVDYFVEDNPKRWNSIVNGLPVYNSSVLLKENTKDLIIIVASQFYTAFSKRLETMGFEERHHFYSSELFDSFLDMKLHFNRAIK